MKFSDNITTLKNYNLYAHTYYYCYTLKIITLFL